jgi:hypothetical protein
MPLGSNSDLPQEVSLFFSLASVFGSFLVVATYLFFPNLRKLRYVQLVACIGVNDLVASIGLSVGTMNRTDGSVGACWFEGFSITWNSLTGIAWACVMAYQLYLAVLMAQQEEDIGLVLKGRLLQGRTWQYLQAACWALPLLLALLPLTTSTYNMTDDGEHSWCSVADRADNSPLSSPESSRRSWELLSFYGWLWAAMVFCTALLVAAALKLRRLKRGPTGVPDEVTHTLNALVPYPVLMVCTWSLNSLVYLYLLATNQRYNDLSRSWSLLSTVAVAVVTLRGVVLCIVFLAVNPLVRSHWRFFFQDLFGCMSFCFHCCGCCCCREGSGSSGADSKERNIWTKKTPDSVSGSGTGAAVVDADTVTRINTDVNSRAGNIPFPPPPPGGGGSSSRSSSHNTSTGSGGIRSSATGGGGGIVASVASSRHQQRCRLATETEAQVDYTGQPGELVAFAQSRGRGGRGRRKVPGQRPSERPTAGAGGLEAGLVVMDANDFERMSAVGGVGAVGGGGGGGGGWNSADDDGEYEEGEGVDGDYSQDDLTGMVKGLTRTVSGIVFCMCVYL